MRALKSITNNFQRAFIMLFIVLFFTPQMQALENGLAKTPPMGWQSWRKFLNKPTEEIIKGMCDVIATNGMRDAGYNYIQVSDGWCLKERDKNGNLAADPKKFPSDMKAMADYILSKGLKPGIYLSPCARMCSGRPGSFGHYDQDAKLVIDWGYEYVFEDYSSKHMVESGALKVGMEEIFRLLRDALLKRKKDVLLVGHLASRYSSKDREFVNCWRIYQDPAENWPYVCDMIDAMEGRDVFAGPGGWNYMGPMGIDTRSYKKGKMTVDESKSIMSIYSLLKTPLWTANDVRIMEKKYCDILINKEVIAINQDPLGKPGIKVKDEGDFEIFSIDLSDKSKSVILFNRSEKLVDMTVKWKDVGFTGSCEVRDLWLHKNMGSFKDSFTAKVNPHGVVMIRINGDSPYSDPKQLVAHWTFDKTVKDEINNRTGNLFNGTDFVENGKKGEALYFDGKDDYAILPNPINPGRNNFTVSLWTKCEEDGTIISSKHGSASFGKSIWLQSRKTFLSCALGDNLKSSSKSLTIKSNLKQWQHCSITWDGTNLKFYSNGDLVSNKKCDFVHANAQVHILGASLYVSSKGKEHVITNIKHHWKGSIDDLKYFNYALTSEELKKLSE